MSKHIQLTNSAPDLLTRLLFLPVGILFFCFGCYAVLMSIFGFLDIITIPAEGSFLYGFIFGVLSMFFGAIIAYVFFVPAETLVFDSDKRSVTHTKTYPFKIHQGTSYKFSDITPPETVWVDDPESFHGDGNWMLVQHIPNNKPFQYLLTDFSKSGIYPKNALSYSAHQKKLSDELVQNINNILTS